MMFCLPRDTCTIRMFSLCQFFLIFLHSIFHFFRVFPSFSFLFIFTPFSFLLCGISSDWESFFFLELSSFLLFFFFFGFLVSFLCSLLCIYAFMVDYSLVRSDFPSISFYFTRSYGLLEVGKRHPKIGLFVGRDCPFRFIFLFLFPLVHRLVGIAQTLAMSGEGD